MSRLANAVHKDQGFPKQSKDFDELSTYLENSTDYTKLLVIFDDAWHNYTYE